MDKKVQIMNNFMYWSKILHMAECHNIAVEMQCRITEYQRHVLAWLRLGEVTDFVQNYKGFLKDNLFLKR